MKIMIVSAEVANRGNDVFWNDFPNRIQEKCILLPERFFIPEISAITFVLELIVSLSIIYRVILITQINT